MLSIARTAAVAVLIAGSAIGSASAAMTNPVPPPQVTRLAPHVQQDLSALEAASNANSGSDLKLWVGGAQQRTPVAIKRFARGIISRTSSIAASLTRSAMLFIGTPYVFGGTSPSGFDCSGYVQYIFAKLGVKLPRTADAQYYAGGKPLGGVTVGDLVFFQTYEPGPSHVGIYLGDGRFIHSSSHGVMISRLGDSYWASRYLGARRFRMN